MLKYLCVKLHQSSVFFYLQLNLLKVFVLVLLIAHHKAFKYYCTINI